ncbi:lysozyme inhibitor LprI family protein [Pontibacter sp. G13]|uniref:lysozyme inhibitor LprI family protein n=1 Tax=Pontibacter sp. G13 TaxID=3074898 RepID=UPI00288B6369|nr:lysozyme inhibitor LprI family protein [Pontibacter sp. G13]WNJ17668.1 lysozyme inhibitor LprI family protein [Pontibacter sp. G13]
MVYRLFIVCCWIGFTCSAWAQEAFLEAHPIDIELDLCLEADSNFTTNAMISCLNTAYMAWDNDLNEHYQLIMDQLSTELQDHLRNSQRSWMAYRDREVEFMMEMYGSFQGTMWKLSIMDRKLEITRKRALELHDYLDVLTFQR